MEAIMWCSSSIHIGYNFSQHFDILALVALVKWMQQIYLGSVLKKSIITRFGIVSCITFAFPSKEGYLSTL